MQNAEKTGIDVRKRRAKKCQRQVRTPTCARDVSVAKVRLRRGQGRRKRGRETGRACGGNGHGDVPPVRAPVPPRRREIEGWIGRDVRRRRVARLVRVRSGVAERGVEHVLPERRVVPDEVLVELLQARYVQERVEGRPEVPVVARVRVHGGVEHVVRHLSQQCRVSLVPTCEATRTRPAIL